MRHGACLCGAVSFTLAGAVLCTGLCHCHLCRRWSGHAFASAEVAAGDLHIWRADGLGWYDSSPGVRRGFCRVCGASLFWQGGAATVEVALGALDQPTGLCIAVQTCAGEAGDYYSPAGPPPPPAPARPGTAQARCLCGGCSFTLPAPVGPVTACHCSQCRRLSSYYAASFDVDEHALVWTSRDTLAEHPSPGGGRRGFCTRCGSSLWFRAADGAFSVEAGAIEGPTGGRLAGHIFVADRGDFYEIDDGLPQSPGA